MSPLYVYAFVDRMIPPLRSRGRAIEFIDVGDLYAAVERRDRAPGVSEQTLEVQHDVVTSIARVVEAILPARFGSMIDREELHRIAVMRGPAIREALDLVRGRAQMTVRLFGEEGPRGNMAPAQPVRGETARSGTQYLQQRRAVSVGRALPEATAAIAAAVAHLLVAGRSEPGRGRILATAYHLIERGSEQVYKDALAPVRSRLGADRVAVSGPWPPFAFAPELWA